MTTKINFNKNLDELVLILKLKKKGNIVRFCIKNFKENIDYIILKPNFDIKKNKKQGGLNEINYFLTEDTFNLCKTTYNLKHKYVPYYNNVEQIKILMTLENQTIGFIENIFKNIFTIERQKFIDKYKVDLYIKEHNIVIECDENNHNDRNTNYEQERELIIICNGYKLIRFNPNEKNFDISNVIRVINYVIFGKCKKQLIKINMDMIDDLIINK